MVKTQSPGNITRGNSCKSQPIGDPGEKSICRQVFALPCSRGLAAREQMAQWLLEDRNTRAQRGRNVWRRCARVAPSYCDPAALCCCQIKDVMKGVPTSGDKDRVTHLLSQSLHALCGLCVCQLKSLSHV